MLPVHTLNEHALMKGLSSLVQQDARTTAEVLAFIAEIDQRKLWAKYAFPSMFAFCVERFHMSEAIAAKRIRAGRAACRFPLIFAMIERGELHLSGVHQLARHLTEENHKEVLARARHKTMREIEHLIAEIAPRPDVTSRVVTLPRRSGPTTRGANRQSRDPAADSTLFERSPFPLTVGGSPFPLTVSAHRDRDRVRVRDRVRDRFRSPHPDQPYAAFT